MFFIEEKGIKVQDIILCPNQFFALIGLDAPYYLTLCKRNANTVNYLVTYIYMTFLLIELKLSYLF